MYKKIPVIGIIFLFFLSTVSSIAISFDSIKTQEDNLEFLRDDLLFIGTDPSCSNNIKNEFFKEQLLKQHTSENSKDNIVEQDENELVLSIEFPSYLEALSGGPMDSPWPMHCFNVHHTGQSPYSTTDNPYNEKWRFKTYLIENTPVISNDGTIYFGGGFNAVPYIIAVNPDGTENWRYKTNGLISGSSPAIAEDGTVYVGCWDWFLYAMYPNGTLKWRVNPGGIISSSAAIAEDGTIYVGQTEGDIVAINPNGTIKWKYNTEDSIFSDPAIGDDGTIYCGSNDKYIYAVNPNGTLKWRFKTGQAVGGAPSIADDGTVYIAGTWDNYLYALYPDNGTIKWKCNIRVSCANPSIYNNGIIYAGGDEKLYAVYPNGTVKWSFDLGNERWIGPSAPAISADGTIYVGTCIGSGVEGGDFIAINSDGTLRWRKKIANEYIHSSPSIAKDGTVYIGSHNEGDDYLHAFGFKELDADANGPYYGLVDDPIQFTGTSSGGYLPYSYFWEFGDTHNSEEQNPIHTYTSHGNYNVILTVTDNKSNTAIDTTFAWIQTTNTAPDRPTINGPTQGTVGVTYDYTFSATDPDNSIIYLYVDWGDNSNTGWKGPYDSGQQVTLSHKWTEENAFTIKAKAKDPYNAEGPWGTLDVTIPRNKAETSNMLLLRILERFPLLQKISIFLTI